jgi:hypothetical protein
MDNKSITTGTKNTSELKLDPFTLVLPVIVFILDCDIRRVYRRKEKYTFLLVKIAFWVFFYAIIGIAAQDNMSIGNILSHDKILRFTNFMFLIWPCIGALYSYALSKFPSFTEPVNAEAAAGVPGSEE